MRILVLNHEFPPVGGGGGRAAEDICRELSKRGYEIKVLTAHIRGLHVKKNGMDITLLVCPPCGLNPIKPVFSPWLPMFLQDFGLVAV